MPVIDPRFHQATCTMVGVVRWPHQNTTLIGKIPLYVKPAASVMENGAFKQLTKCPVGFECGNEASIMLMYDGKSRFIRPQTHASMRLMLRGDPPAGGGVTYNGVVGGELVDEITQAIQTCVAFTGFEGQF